MKVLKFGGTSVASAGNISRVRDIVSVEKQTGPVVVVVSALGGTTNLLEEAGMLAIEDLKKALGVLRTIEKRHKSVASKLFALPERTVAAERIAAEIRNLAGMIKGIHLTGEMTPRLKDQLLSAGEKLSSQIISHFLSQEFATILLNPAGFIITDDSFGNARVNYETTYRQIARLKEQLKEQTGVCPGFIGATADGRLTTLGRGGSDFTAALLARGLEAAELQIWTDVSGMMTADPQVVKSARVIDRLSYEEAMELSHFGARVIYPPTIHPVMERGISLHIRNTLRPADKGTLIAADTGNGDKTVQGLSSITNLALVNLKGSGMVGVPSLSYRLFRCFARQNINVVLITQASSEHTISVVINQGDVLPAAREVRREFEQEIKLGIIEPLEIEKNLAVVALVGSNMRKQVGVSGKMFTSLGANGVNIKAIAQGSSELNISVVIDEKDLKKSLNCLHESFFLSDRRRVNLFVAGTGNVGSAFLEQLREQSACLLESEGLDIRVVGLINSRNMKFDNDGIELANWRQLLADGGPASMPVFVEQMKKMNLRNSIFIDNTASGDIPARYITILQSSISVVTPNKTAASASYEQYLAIKKTARRYRAQFLFETNVGAGLPVISTLNDLVRSGDKIIAIEAVLSGSLNFIFNQYNGKLPFARIVEQAMQEGYTEPDPRIDLSGLDVRRKLLILMREAGVPCEMEDIRGEAFVPAVCFDSNSTDEFLHRLDENEPAFRKLHQEGTAGGGQLKYVARYHEHRGGTVGLLSVNPGHPFYNLQGKDNIVLFYTRRYAEQPLLIKGAGAGAEVTASGIFADVMKVVNSW